MKSGFGLRVRGSLPGSPTSRKRQASNRFSPKPVRLIDFRNCFGMMASVSTLARSSGTTSPVWTVNFSMTTILAEALQEIRELEEHEPDEAECHSDHERAECQRHAPKEREPFLERPGSIELGTNAATGIEIALAVLEEARLETDRPIAFEQRHHLVDAVAEAGAGVNHRAPDRLARKESGDLGDARLAEGLLPRLVRRLVRSRPTIERVRIDEARRCDVDSELDRKSVV